MSKKKLKKIMVESYTFYCRINHGLFYRNFIYTGQVKLQDNYYFLYVGKTWPTKKLNADTVQKH